MQSKDNKNLEIPFKNENEMKNQTFLQYKFDWYMAYIFCEASSPLDSHLHKYLQTFLLVSLVSCRSDVLLLSI